MLVFGSKDCRSDPGVCPYNFYLEDKDPHDDEEDVQDIGFKSVQF